jgi:hypothetical protein
MVSRPAYLAGSMPDFHGSGESNSYRHLVWDLTTRHLTRKGDIFRSMLGILQLLAFIHPEKYICYLPSSMLEWALGWQPTGSLRRRKTFFRAIRSQVGHGSVGSDRGVPGRAHPDIILLHVDDRRLHTPTSTLSFDNTTQAVRPRTTATESTTNYMLEHLHTFLLPFHPVANPGKIHPRWTRWATPAAPTDASKPAMSQDEVVVQRESTRLAFVSRLRKPKPNAGSLTPIPPRSSFLYSQILSSHQSFMDSLHPLLESGLLIFTACSAHFCVFTAELANGSAFTNLVGAYKIHSSTSGAWVGVVVLPSGLLQTTHAPMGCAPAEFILLSNTQRLYFREAAPGFDSSTYTEQYVRWCTVMWVL